MNCLRGIKNALEREDKILQGLLAGFANMNHINFTDALISVSVRVIVSVGALTFFVILKLSFS